MAKPLSIIDLIVTFYLMLILSERLICKDFKTW